MSPPSPPPTPDPYKTAAAQTAANLTTAIGQTVLQNADEDHPDGGVRYTQSGTYIIDDPVYDTDGNQTGTTQRSIPRWKRSVTLNAKNQLIKDQQDDVKLAFADAAKIQTTNLNAKLATPFDLDGIPNRGVAPIQPATDFSRPVRAALVRSIGGGVDVTVARQTALDKINERLQQQLDWDNQKVTTDLECKGIYPGSEAYEYSMKRFDWSKNDARVQAYLAASKEVEAQIAIDERIAKFQNDAAELDFRQQVLSIEITNSTAFKHFQALLQLASYVDARRQQAIQERVLERGQGVNEISSLMHGGQISVPQFQGFNPGKLDNTPVGQYVYQSAALDMQKWQTQVQYQQSMMGGMLSLGGSLLSGGMMMSDPELKKDIGPAETFVEKLAKLDIKSWRYTAKAQRDHGLDDALHLGPMADKFAEIFEGNGHTIDAGVAAEVVLQASQELGISPVDVFGLAFLILKTKSETKH